MKEKKKKINCPTCRKWEEEKLMSSNIGKYCVVKNLKLTHARDPFQNFLIIGVEGKNYKIAPLSIQSTFSVKAKDILF